MYTESPFRLIQKLSCNTTFLCFLQIMELHQAAYISNSMYADMCVCVCSQHYIQYNLWIISHNLYKFSIFFSLRLSFLVFILCVVDKSSLYRYKYIIEENGKEKKKRRKSKDIVPLYTHIIRKKVFCNVNIRDCTRYILKDKMK